MNQRKTAMKKRIIVQDLRRLANDDVQLLATLHSTHNIMYSHLATMQVDGHPVTREHLALASSGKTLPDGLVAPIPEPPRKIMQRQVAIVQMGYLASIYDRLHATWRKETRVDAKHLLASWEIFVVTVMPTMFSGRKVTQVPDPSVCTALDMRTHWVTIRSLCDGLIDLVACEGCGKPHLQVLDASPESNWAMLPAGCLACSHTSKVRRRHGVAKSVAANVRTVDFARHTPAQGGVQGLGTTKARDTLEPCEPLLALLAD